MPEGKGTRARRDMRDDAANVTSEIGPWAMVPVWVLGCGLKPAELAVYIALRSFANQAGTAWPTSRTIAARANVALGTCRNAIRELRDKHLIRTEERLRPDGSTAGLHYWIRDTPPPVDSDSVDGEQIPDDGSVDGSDAPDDAGGYTSQCTGGTPASAPIEHTNEHTNEQDDDDARAPKIEKTSKPKRRSTTSGGRADKKRHRQRRTVVADLIDRLDVDHADAELLCDYLLDTFPVVNPAAYVAAIGDDSLLEHLDDARVEVEIEAERRADAEDLTGQLAKLVPDLTASEREAVNAAVYASLAAGQTYGRVAEGLNAAARSQGSWRAAVRWFVAGRQTPAEAA